MPYVLKNLGANLPSWLDDSDNGKRMWATIFCFGALLPLSLPRKLTALRFSSLLSFVISLFVIFTIFTLSFTGTAADDFKKHDFKTRFSDALHTNRLSVGGVFKSLPLIIFSYMYQPNIPAIYHELKRSDLISMQKVLFIGTMLATVGYVMTGLFGYVTFASNPLVDEIMQQ